MPYSHCLEHHLSICLVNSILCIPGILKFDKAKALRLPRLRIKDNLRRDMVKIVKLELIWSSDRATKGSTAMPFSHRAWSMKKR